MKKYAMYTKNQQNYKIYGETEHGVIFAVISSIRTGKH